MPIVINEIEIAVEVTPNGNGQTGSPPSIPGHLKEDIVKECVEKIMEILNQKNER